MGRLNYSYFTILLLSSILAIAHAACPSNCVLCNADENYCYLCASGYGNNFIGGCSPSNEPNCFIFDTFDKCYTCFPTFSIVNNVCTKNYKGCLNEGPNGECYQCGFGLNLSGTACKGVINCEKYDGNMCSQCSSGYQLLENKCTDVSGNCQKVRSQDGICEACKQGYYLSGYRCIEDSYKNERCAIIKNSTFCMSCKNTFLNLNGECLTQEEDIERQISGKDLDLEIPAGCEIYDSVAKLCIRCYYEFFLKDDKCESVSVFCEGYDLTNGNCLGCKYGLSLQNGKCIDPNCLNAGPDGCLECKAGFKIGQNILCQLSDANCLSSLSDRCQECASNFFVNLDGFCEPNPQGCAVVNYVNKECLECLPNYILNFTTKICSQQVVIPNCVSVNPQNMNQCLKCAQRYYVGGNQCLKVSDLCNAYNVQNGQCLSCISPKLRLTAGRCNDANCLSQAGVPCTQCKDGYAYSQQERICKINDPDCISVSITQEVCLICRSGYYLNEFKRCIINPANCVKAGATGVCEQCAIGYQLRNNICQIRMIENCQQMDLNTRICMTCVAGFTLTQQGTCNYVIANCMQANSTTRRCMTCDAGFTLTQQGTCNYVIANCMQVNSTTRRCMTCVAGFTLTDQGVCTSSRLIDIHCIQYAGSRCISCSNRYFLNTQGICEQVNVLCQTYNSSGFCVNCYPGYSISNGQCIIAQVVITDPNCIRYTNNTCQSCANRYYVSSDAKCVPVNPYCKDYNVRGQCTSCYPGYEVSQGLCIIKISSDPNCRTFNGSVCRLCYAGFFVKNGICTMINPLCNGYNSTTGSCLDCYPGYSLNRVDGSCGILSKDPYCKTFDANNACIQCFEKFFFNSQRSCEAVSPYCKTHDFISGKCTSCYQGYSLTGGACELGVTQVTNCKNFVGNVCNECYQGYFVKDGDCEKLNRLCKTYNQNDGACTSCYSGYIVSGGNCIVDEVKDNYCKNFTGTTCVQCYQGYIVIGGVCQIQNPSCREIDLRNGKCSACWQGYFLQDGNCLLIQTNLITNSDTYCLRYANNICVECSLGFFYNQTSKKCTQLDVTCSQHNLTTGACLGCFEGYVLSNQKCLRVQQLSVPNCLTINYQTAECQQCFSGYFLSTAKTCQAVSITCASYNRNNGNCLTCIPGHYLTDGTCQMAAIYDENCAAYSAGFCIKCINGYFVSQYRCKRIN